MPVKIQDILNIPEPSDQEWDELEEAWRSQQAMEAVVEPHDWVRLPPSLRPAPMRPVPTAPSRRSAPQQAPRRRRFVSREGPYWDEPAP